MVDNTHIKINKAISLVICILLVKYSSSDYCWIWAAQHLVFITCFVRQDDIQAERLLLKVQWHFKWGSHHYNSFIFPFTSSNKRYIVMTKSSWRGCVALPVISDANSCQLWNVLVISAFFSYYFLDVPSYLSWRILSCFFMSLLNMIYSLQP